MQWLGIFVLGTLTTASIVLFTPVFPENTITTQYKMENLAYQSSDIASSSRGIREDDTESSIWQVFLDATKQVSGNETGSGVVNWAVVRYRVSESEILRC